MSRLLVAPMLVLATTVAVLLPRELGAQTHTDRLEAWRHRLARIAPGAWIASNATWQEEDGGTERYGLDWELLPGGVGARGCLWGEGGQTRTVHWEFSQYWDPLVGEGVIVQTGGAGAIALGRIDPLAPESEMMVQTMVQPDGARFEIGHTTEMAGPDTRIDRSFRRAVGATEWTPGRSYTWERRAGVEAPCWS